MLGTWVEEPFESTVLASGPVGTLDDTFNQIVTILDPNHTTGADLSLQRDYTPRWDAACHVKVFTAYERSRMKMTVGDVSHNLWFQFDPRIDERNMVEWRGTRMRLRGACVDLHGLGEIFEVPALAIGTENESEILN